MFGAYFAKSTVWVCKFSTCLSKEKQVEAFARTGSFIISIPGTRVSAVCAGWPGPLAPRVTKKGTQGCLCPSESVGLKTQRRALRCPGDAGGNACPLHAGVRELLLPRSSLRGTRGEGNRSQDTPETSLDPLVLAVQCAPGLPLCCPPCLDTLLSNLAGLASSQHRRSRSSISS